MRFSLKYLATRLHVRHGRFFTMYTIDEVQSQKTDESIINFLILNSTNINDYGYIILKNR